MNQSQTNKAGVSLYFENLTHKGVEELLGSKGLPVRLAPRNDGGEVNPYQSQHLGQAVIRHKFSIGHKNKVAAGLLIAGLILGRNWRKSKIGRAAVLRQFIHYLCEDV